MIGVSYYSKKLTLDIVNAINGVEIPADDRSRTAGALFDMVHEHHQAIVILLAKRLYGSAGALLRSIFETYARGVWFMKCASSDDLVNFQQDQFKKGTFEDRLKEIDAVDGDAHGGLLNVKSSAWTALNSYTHGGFRAVSRRFRGHEMMANYAPEEIAEIERVASSFAVLAVFQIAEISGSERVIKEAERLAIEFQEKYS
ncbi:MAG: hypothetical protein IBX64_12815 [Actinobacteria bacterium]|nr:hypothetical protein [Actinomycetota bacterium]